LKTLIIRTDKLGDLYITLPFINLLRRNFGRDNIDILISENIYDHFKEKDYIFGNIYSFPNKGFFKKILLILKLRKYLYKHIIIFDGKDRSLILAFLLKSLKKIILMEKRKLNFLLKIFFLKNKKYNLIYDNKIESYHSLYSKLLSQFNVQINETDYRFLKYEKFEFLNLPKNLKEDSTDYTLIHIDEKWFSNYYIKEYTDIAPTDIDFINFIQKIIIKTNKNIIITTGIVKLPFFEKLKDNYFKKIDNKLYEFEFNNIKVFMFLNSSIKELEIISMNSKNLITCNNPLSQIAGSFNINLIDIIEKRLEPWYLRHVSHIKKYNKLFRKDFRELSNEILLKII